MQSSTYLRVLLGYFEPGRSPDIPKLAGQLKIASNDKVA
jgi:hypothetical protein